MNMEDDDDDDYSIDASPTKPSPSCSKRSELLLRRKTRTVQENNDSRTKRAPITQWPCRTPNQQSRLDLQSAWELREEQLFEADRLDCLRAQQEPLRVRAVPASQNFSSLQSMLESQQMPMEQASPEPEATEQLLSKPGSIVQEILRDFCSSPTYIEEQLPPDDASPWFRFRGKKIKTFGHKRPTAISASTADDEDRLSCSSELSVQEDYTTQVPTTTHCAFDANSSQKICENLLNLSAFFTQNNANKSIDLPDMQTDPKNCTAIEAIDYEQEDAADVIENMGYFLGSTEQCKLLEENCDIKMTDDAEFSLFVERSRLLTRETPVKVGQSQEANLCGDWFKADFVTQKLKVPFDKTETKDTTDSESLEGIPFSEWQPIDIANSAIEVPDANTISASHKKEWQATDCKQLELIAFSEWQPDATEFRTASSKLIKVSEQHQKEAAKFMADLEESYSQKPSELVNGRDSAGIQFRTASNKTMKITEEMRRKAAMLMADLETVIGNPPEAHEPQTESNSGLDMNTSTRGEITTDCEMLDGIPLSEWQPMDIPDSKQTPAETYVCSQLDMIPFSEWQPMDMPDAVEFRTASNKTIEVSEEKQKEAAELMADLEASYSQQIGVDKSNGNLKSDVSVNVEFRTASNKIVELTEEMRERAAMLMADLDVGSLNPQEKEKEQSEKMQLKECPSERSANAGSEANQNRSLHTAISENIEFRTASNKIVKLTEEMRQRAAMLMADLEVGSLNQQEEEKEHLDKRCASRNISESVAKSRKLITAEDIEKGFAEPTSDSIDGIASFKPETRIGLTTATPQQPQLVTQKNSETLNVPFETPKCTPELQSSLTQLSERSPLDKATKSSIITRRNLLSLNKRRKQKRDAENCSADAGHTPIRRFAPMAASTSTPMPNRKDNVEGESQRVMRDRSCSQESPRVHRERVGKRKSEEALSPIYAPTTKTRRLGLSRIRNKSNHDI